MIHTPTRLFERRPDELKITYKDRFRFGSAEGLSLSLDAAMDGQSHAKAKSLAQKSSVNSSSVEAEGLRLHTANGRPSPRKSVYELQRLMLVMLCKPLGSVTFSRLWLK